MADFMFDKAREDFLNADIDWAADTIKCAFVDNNDITPPAQSAADPTLANISAGIIGTAQTLASKTSTSGVADAADPVFTALTGDQVEAFYIWKDTGTESTSRLICKFDASSGLPLTPSGGNVTFQFDSGANKIFKL
jgi:hypothetical protein